MGMTNKLAGMVGVLLIVLIIGGLAIAKVGPFATRTVWSAVFLGDNEVFFGHLKDVSSTEIDLTNVYYLQKSTPAASGTSTTQPPASLSITGLVANQIQCPTDFLRLNRNAVLYWQDLQDSSYVVTQLNQLVGKAQTCFTPPAATATPVPGLPTATAAPATPTPTASPTSSGRATPTP